MLEDWKEYLSIDDLKRIVERRNYSAFVVSAGAPLFSHVTLKSFPRQITRADCREPATPVQLFVRIEGDGDAGKLVEGESTEPLRVMKKVRARTYFLYSSNACTRTLSCNRDSPHAVSGARGSDPDVARVRGAGQGRGRAPSDQPGAGEAPHPGDTRTQTFDRIWLHHTQPIWPAIRDRR